MDDLGTHQDQLGAMMLRQRRVQVTGDLDAAAVIHLGTQLMTLDAQSTDSIELIINSPGGPADDILALLDIVGLMRGPVNTTVTGRAMGTACVLAAVGTGVREASAHATLSLRLGRQDYPPSTADELARLAQLQATNQQAITDVLVGATGQDATVMSEELRAGPLHTPSDALALGLLDQIRGQGPS